MSKRLWSDQESKLVLVGNPEEIHVGSHLSHAANDLGISTEFLDVRDAFRGPGWYVKLCWHARGHRPPQLRRFSQALVDVCLRRHPGWLLTTGFAPIDSRALVEIGRLGVIRLNYLTDDPWNPAHRAPWFRQALPHYDHVYSPRRSNLEDLRQLGCKHVSYLPFAYAPHVHYPEAPASRSEDERHGCDVVFAGGADRDRIPYLSAIIKNGYRLALYGGYWDRFPETRRLGRGQADSATLRKAIGCAKVALCLVRRANRDGHAMRSFEVAASGACMLVEDTPEHREMFGDEGTTVSYFSSIQSMLDRLSWLVDNDSERRRLGAAAYARIVGDRNTYGDRLAVMLGLETLQAAPVQPEAKLE